MSFLKTRLNQYVTLMVKTGISYKGSCIGQCFERPGTHPVAPENTNAIPCSPTNLQCDIPSICPVLKTKSNQGSPLLVSLCTGKSHSYWLEWSRFARLRTHSYRLDRRIPSRPFTDRQNAHTTCFVQNTDTQITLDFSQGQSSKAFFYGPFDFRQE